jgi:RNA polymerase-binding transcription factor DksA
MTKLNNSDLDRYRRQLDVIQDRLRSDTSTVSEQAREASGGQGAGQLSNAPLHLGDTGTEEFLHDMNTTLLENEQYLLRETLDAEQRIEAGTYGVCEDCGKRIRRERLDAIPYARYCVQCAEKNDRQEVGNVNQGRPHDPGDTIAPEGEMQEARSPRGRKFEEASPRTHRGDIHAAGTAGGGTSLGGLAGTNIGHGDPAVNELQDAAGSGTHDANEARGKGDEDVPKSGRTGGAVGGTPARKRSK